MLLLAGSTAAFATTYTVTDTTDNAADTGSLRYAVNTAANGDTIAFSNVFGTITLTGGTLTLNNNVTVTGPGATLLTISGNNAVPVFTIYAGGTVSIYGLTIANGSSSSSGGGIAHIFTTGALAVDNCIFFDNTTTGGGGGLASNGTLTIENSSFIGNTAGSGGAAGGLYNAGTATIENSTFYDNSSPGGPGGGLFNNNIMTVNNITVTGNIGDGIFNNSSGPAITVNNSIVAGNSGGDCDGCGTQSTYNLLGGDPQLGPPQFNGGPIETMLPLPGSPAIGAGSNSALATDERGFARPTSGSSDLGAVSTSYAIVTNLNDSGTGSLRAAIIAANTHGAGDIGFFPGLTGRITLASVLPSITANMNIVGPGANLLAIDGGNTSAIIDIPNPGTLVNLYGVTISDGNTVSNAALVNYGFLTIGSSFFSSNTGNQGGAILNVGTLEVENSTFANNVATFGGGISNQVTLLVANSTFTGNRAYNGNGGAIENDGNTIAWDDTVTGNQTFNGAVGAGMHNGGSLISVANSIVAANTNVTAATEDDCSGCTQSGPMLTGATSPGLASLGIYGTGATVETMLPLPGSPAIDAGDATLLPVGLSIDERGFPRLTGGKLDLGAAQTNYTALQFVQQPANTVFNATLNPVALQLLETNSNLPAPGNTDAVNNASIPLTLNGPGVLSGTTTETTLGGVATFTDLSVDTVHAGDTLAASLTVTPTGYTPVQVLTATSDSFDITLKPSTVAFSPAPPGSATYGVSPLTLAASVSSSGSPTGQTLTFQVDSGPATVSGNVLTITGAGTVVVEADAAATGTYATASSTASIAVAQAASSLALAASSNDVALAAGVTLTATASSTAGVPTGTVIFSSGGAQVATAQLSSGVATASVGTLPLGSNTITASYAGDANFSGSQAQLSSPIVVGNPGLTITSNPTALTIQRGQTGTAILTLTPAFGYTGTVNLSCGGLPEHTTCDFSPASITFANATTPVTATLTIATDVHGQQRSGTMAEIKPHSPHTTLPILPAIFFWLPGTGLEFEDGKKTERRKLKRRSIFMAWISLLIVGATLLCLTGCGASSGTPTGQQSVMISAAGAGGVNQTLALQVTID